MPSGARPTDVFVLALAALSIVSITVTACLGLHTIRLDNVAAKNTELLDDVGLELKRANNILEDIHDVVRDHAQREDGNAAETS